MRLWGDEPRRFPDAPPVAWPSFSDTGVHHGPVTVRAMLEGCWYLDDPDNAGSPLTPWVIARNALQ